MKEFERLKREVVYKGAIIDFCKDTLKLPNGKIVEWDHIDHKGAVAVVAITEDNKIVMIRQYRPSLDRFVLELPAGGVELGEEWIKAAARELEEETGYRCTKIEPLFHLQTTVAFTNERIGIFLASELQQVSQHLDEEEFIQIEYYSLEELEDMILNGIIEDGKTISALLFYKMRKSTE